jgi:GNAT superfamily N-acetyltransferase|eukprot:Transcript_26290.p1 GENE.Transcript_26290~~Transcript_26290.p1  ORF type:complete len:216 (-),score=29.51 Transcript_26290:173-820(-)
MATHPAEVDLSVEVNEEPCPVRLRLLKNMPPHILSSLLTIEREAFPECERLGNYMQEHAMQRNNGCVIAEDQPSAGAFPLPPTEPMGFLLFSRTAEAGIIMKIAVAAAPQHATRALVATLGRALRLAGCCATPQLLLRKQAFRGRGVGTALLRCGISELRRPLRRAPPPAIMLHVDPSRIAARRMYESSGFVEERRLSSYYGDGRDALLMKLVLR